MGRSRTPDLGKKEIQSENKLKDASFWMKMESKEDEKWSPKNTVIVAQKKQTKEIGTTNLKELKLKKSSRHGVSTG